MDKNSRKLASWRLLCVPFASSEEGEREKSSFNPFKLHSGRMPDWLYYKEAKGKKFANCIKEHEIRISLPPRRMVWVGSAGGKCEQTRKLSRVVSKEGNARITNENDSIKGEEAKQSINQIRLSCHSFSHIKFNFSQFSQPQGEKIEKVFLAPLEENSIWLVMVRAHSMLLVSPLRPSIMHEIKQHAISTLTRRSSIVE